jgi:hypothetical protein
MKRKLGKSTNESSDKNKLSKHVYFVVTKGDAFNEFKEAISEGDIKKLSNLIKFIDKQRAIKYLSNEFEDFGPYYALQCFFLLINDNALSGYHDSASFKKMLSLLPLEISGIDNAFKTVEEILESDKKPFHVQLLNDAREFILSKTRENQINTVTDSDSNNSDTSSNTSEEAKESTDSQNQIETGSSNEKSDIKHDSAANYLPNNQDSFLSFFVNKASVGNKVDNSDSSTFIYNNDLLEMLLLLPKWLQNHNLIKALIETAEQMAAIYDKMINAQSLFDKKLSVDFAFKHDESDDDSEYSDLNNIDEKLVLMQNTSTNDLFDISMKLDRDLVPYSILPVDMGISHFAAISGNMPVLGSALGFTNADFYDQGIVA